MRLSTWKRNTKTTYAQALKLEEPETRLVLTRILTDYIHQRISWLLKDLGKRESEDEEIGENIEKFVENATARIGYDDAKEILLNLLKNQKLSPKGVNAERMARREVVEIISGAMNSIGLGRPKVGRDGKRIMQVAE